MRIERKGDERVQAVEFEAEMFFWGGKRDGSEREREGEREREREREFFPDCYT